MCLLVLLINKLKKRNKEKKKVIEQCFLGMLYKVVVTFESVDEILKCNHLNESY